jgi:hypothetical protein
MPEPCRAGDARADGAEATPYLKRMETEEIDEVVMELFERVDDPA